MKAFVRHSVLSGEQPILTSTLLCNVQSVVKAKLHLEISRQEEHSCACKLIANCVSHHLTACVCPRFSTLCMVEMEEPCSISLR